MFSPLAALHRLSLVLGASLDLARECKVFIDWLEAETAARLAALFVAETRRDTLQLLASSGLEKPTIALPLGYDPWLWLEEQNISLPAGERYALPITLEGEVFGLLAVVSVQTGSALADEQNLLELALAYLAPVLRNIERYQNVERLVEERTAQLRASEKRYRQLSAELEQRVEERTRQLREAQEQLLQQERLAVLGRLASGVAHELRNPLGVITNAVYYLQMTLPKSEQHQIAQEYLGILQNETRTAAKIIADLLDYAVIPPPDRQPISLSEIVRCVLQNLPPPPGIQVNLDLPASLPPAYVDAHQIEQAVGNLVLNAYQAMPEGGQVSMSGKQLSAADEQSRTTNLLQLTIRDTGPGIPPEHMNKLFNPLFSTKAHNIGLGLAVSKKLVEANGGRIEVESAVSPQEKASTGAAFTLTLPVQPPTES